MISPKITYFVGLLDVEEMNVQKDVNIYGNELKILN